MYYPHKVLISYEIGSGSIVNGNYVAGSRTEIEVQCRIEVNNSDRRYLISGDEIKSDWVILCAHFDGQEDIPVGARITGVTAPKAFSDLTSLKILSIMKLRRKTEIDC